MHHLYFASCVTGGGIYHYYLKNGKLHFAEKTVCDQPMYLEAGAGCLKVLLKQPFDGSKDSGLTGYALLADGSLGGQSWTDSSVEPQSLRTNTKGEGACHRLPISTKGEEACHLCSWRGRTFVANYMSGSIFSSDGKVKQHCGTGVHPDRQEAPHLHFVSPSPDGQCLLAVDLGLDSIYGYDEELNLLSVSQVPAGCGPRHLAYFQDGQTVFCANELDSSVTVFRYREQRLVEGETVSLLTERNPENTAAAIRVQGNYVYVSNRGNDSISCLEWDGTALKLRSETSCGGSWPRDFLIVEDLLFCTNERSDTVTIFQVNGPVLTLKEERLSIPAPLCVAEMVV